MGGKARRPALDLNQRYAWVLKGKDGRYARLNGPVYIPVRLSEAHLFPSTAEAYLWNPKGTRAVKVIVTTGVKEAP